MAFLTFAEAKAMAPPTVSRDYLNGSSLNVGTELYKSIWRY